MRDDQPRRVELEGPPTALLRSNACLAIELPETDESAADGQRWAIPVSDAHLDDCLDLHGKPERQCGHPDGGSSQSPDAVASGTYQQVGRSVGDELLAQVLFQQDLRRHLPQWPLGT